jgi:mRNA interferase MazF
MWRVDLGYLGKVRPALVVSVPFSENERTLCIVVPHTTSLRGTRFEVSVRHPALSGGAFDVQQMAAVQSVRFIQRLGTLKEEQMSLVEQALVRVLGLKLVADDSRSC